MSDDVRYRDYLRNVALAIVELVLEKDKEYGASWKRRGGVGAAMNMLRKFDRIEEQLRPNGYDVFAALAKTTGQTTEDIRDTLRDAVGYALLTLAEDHARRTPTDLPSSSPGMADLYSDAECKCGHARSSHLLAADNTSRACSFGHCNCLRFR